MTQEIVLYDYWRSSAAYRVRIALGLKQINYRKVPIDLTGAEQSSPEHLARNPQGSVPVLEIDGLCLTQSWSILEYLEETRPSPALMPQDAATRARLRAIALAVVADIHPLSNLKILKRVETMAGEQARAQWNIDNIFTGLRAVEQMLQGDQFALGDSPSLADCVLIPQIYNARRWGVEMDQMPHLLRIEQSAADHPVFQTAAPRQ